MLMFRVIAFRQRCDEGLKHQLNDQTLSSEIVFVTPKIRWLNEQTLFDLTSDRVSPHNALYALPLKL